MRTERVTAMVSFNKLQFDLKQIGLIWWMCFESIHTGKLSVRLASGLVIQAQ